MTKTSLLPLYVLAALLGLATSPHAQMLKGDRVRLELESGRKVEGRWVGANADSITIARDDTIVPIDRAWIERVQRYEGRHRNWGKGAAIGAVAGFVLGGLAVALGEEQSGSDMAASFIGLTIFCAAPGALIGGLIKSDTWENVPIDNLSVLPSVRDQKIAFVLNASF